MAIRTRKSGTGKSSTRKQRGTSSRSSAAVAAPQLPGISAAERRKLAQEEARWRAESDLRTLRQAEEIRRDPARLKRADISTTSGCGAIPPEGRISLATHSADMSSKAAALPGAGRPKCPPWPSR